VLYSSLYETKKIHDFLIAISRNAHCHITFRFNWFLHLTIYFVDRVGTCSEPNSERKYHSRTSMRWIEMSMNDSRRVPKGAVWRGLSSRSLRSLYAEFPMMIHLESNRKMLSPRFHHIWKDYRTYYRYANYWLYLLYSVASFRF